MSHSCEERRRPLLVAMRFKKGMLHTMTRIRIVGAALVVVFALSAIAASAASAAYTGPEFSKESNTFTGSGGESVLKNTNGTLTCTSLSLLGTLSLLGFRNVTIGLVTYKGCSGKVSGKTCPAEISTVKLTGQLGDVAEAESATKVGLLLKPESGATFAEFECEGLKVKVQGSIAGEVTPVETLGTESKVVFTPSGTGMKIKTVTINKGETSEKAEKPALELSVGGKASLSSTVNQTAAEAVSVKV